MSDQSDSGDEQFSDDARSLVEGDSDETDANSLLDSEATDSDETDANSLLDLEAAEDFGEHDGEDDEAEEYEEYDYEADRHRPFHDSFPQFSLLPPELRAMVWEAVDPFISSKARVLNVIVVNSCKRDELWETATLAAQTAGARKLLAICRESHRVALRHYPDILPLRSGRGKVPFNGASDVILLSSCNDLRQVSDVAVSNPKIKYLGLDATVIDLPEMGSYFWEEAVAPELCRNLKAFFFCWCANAVDDISHLDWSVSDTVNRFPEEGLSIPDYDYELEEPEYVYFWPDTTLGQELILRRPGDGARNSFPELPKISGLPVWPMVQYAFDDDLQLYRSVKRRYGPGASELEESDDFESSDGDPASSEFEDTYDDLDGFIDDMLPEGEELSGNEEEEDDQSDQDSILLNSFSPIEVESEDDTSGTLRGPEDPVSDASLSEEQSPIAKPRGRPMNRRIVSSDDEDESDDAGPQVGSSSRAQIIISDSEQSPIAKPPGRSMKRRIISSDSEEDSSNGAGPEVGNSFRANRRARVILADSDDDDHDHHDEGVENENGGETEAARNTITLSDSENATDESEETDRDVEKTEEQENDDAGGSLRSKLVSLQARMRQFIADVSVYENEGWLESAEEEEEYDDEFPESDGEDEESSGEGEAGEDDEDDEDDEDGDQSEDA
ncbi:hypothetical protein GGR50DRAFT_646133 [Xylaria sp. CBS 124048]|nr:hypothetical protein GGR50DRAFT_646133 [Xylaria sp. CBS 124048]